MFFLSAHGKQPCILCRVVRRQCSEIVRVFIYSKKAPCEGFLFGVAPRIYFNRCLPIMQLLFGWNQCPCVKTTPAKSSCGQDVDFVVPRSIDKQLGLFPILGPF